MVIASFTNIGTEYEVTLDQNGQADSCSCSDHKYRGHKPGHICKHRINANGQVMAEIEKAERFLSLKEQYDYRSQSVRDARRAAYTALYNPCSID